VEEGEPYLVKTSNAYGQYLVWYPRLLEQEARWEEAQAILKQAVEVFEQIGNPVAIASSLNNISSIYRVQGKLEQAIEHYARSLHFYESLELRSRNRVG
jgi:tetratricopeptide (TPR) repeat protein